MDLHILAFLVAEILRAYPSANSVESTTSHNGQAWGQRACRPVGKTFRYKDCFTSGPKIQRAFQSPRPNVSFEHLSSCTTRNVRMYSMSNPWGKAIKVTRDTLEVDRFQNNRHDLQHLTNASYRSALRGVHQKRCDAAQAYATKNPNTGVLS